MWDDVPREMRIPESSSLGFDYYRNSMEAMISGAPRGFYLYKEVEWIELPVRGEDADIVASQIRNAGEFELVFGEDGLRLYAYREIAFAATPNPSIEGMPNRLCRSVTPHVKR